MWGWHLRTVRKSFSLYWNLENHLSKINRDPQGSSLSLGSLFKGLCCLAFISGTQLCRKRMMQCVFEQQIQQHASGKNASALPCELWENSTVVQRKTTKWKNEKRTWRVCTTNDMMLWQTVSLFCVEEELCNLVSLLRFYHEGLWWTDVGKIDLLHWSLASVTPFGHSCKYFPLLSNTGKTFSLLLAMWGFCLCQDTPLLFISAR